VATICIVEAERVRADQKVECQVDLPFLTRRYRVSHGSESLWSVAGGTNSGLSKACHVSEMLRDDHSDHTLSH
jgi:hypothetical protein